MIVKHEIDLSKPVQFTEDRLKMIEALRQMDDDDIDCSDIPARTPEQLKEFKRVSDMPEHWKRT